MDNELQRRSPSRNTMVKSRFLDSTDKKIQKVRVKSVDDIFDHNKQDSSNQVVNDNVNSRYTAQQVDPNRSKMFQEAKLRIIPLGGVEEIGGKNCTVLEYKNDIVIIDMGFMFPDETMPGVDYVIPDVSYLEQNKHKIRGLIVTHGHLDHIGAIPYVYEKNRFPDYLFCPINSGSNKRET